MRYGNGLVFGEDGFFPGGFVVENGLVTQLLPEGEEGIDLGGRLVLPGLVDIHVHGSAGADFSDGDRAGLQRMGRYLLSRGVTSFLPTSMTLPDSVLARAFQTAADLGAHPPPECARVLGVHMEGPFFSAEKRGAQNGAYLKAPDFAAFAALFQDCGGFLRLVDLAPELPGAVEFTRQAGALCRVSVAHTAATYEEAAAVFDAGASHLTHLYNAMPPLLHRAPGPIGAALERENVTAELICDGYHVHPAAVRAAFRLFPGRLCLISDALRCAGMPEGAYELGGERIFLRDGAARLPSGALAGSASNLYEGMKNAIRYDVPAAEAIRSASLYPAKAIGLADRVGSLAPGKYADFLLCGKNWELQAVYLGGQEAWRGDRAHAPLGAEA